MFSKEAKKNGIIILYQEPKLYSDYSDINIPDILKIYQMTNRF